MIYPPESVIPLSFAPPVKKQLNTEMISYRIPIDMKKRLDLVVQKAEVNETDFCRRCLDAAIRAVEEAGYEFGNPLRFVLKKTLTDNPSSRTE